MRGILLAAVATAVLSAASAGAQPAETFFKGKTVTYVVATGAGGGYDYYGRLVAEYMERHLPGTTFVVRNMPGAGHMIGANHIYGSRADGLTIGTFNTGLIYNQLVKLEGVKFDLTKMSWIGKAATEPRVLMTDPRTPYATLADLRAAKQPVNFSASGVGSAAYVETRLLTELLRIPNKIITGYSGNDELLAIRRGEIQAAIGSPSSYDDFVKNGYGRIAFQIGGVSPAGIPQLRDLIAQDGPEARAVVALIESQGEVQRFTAGPPDIPADRLALLRQAYRRALEDRGLREKAAKGGRPIEPAYGDDVAKLIRAALDQPPAVVALLTATLAEGKRR